MNEPPLLEVEAVKKHFVLDKNKTIKAIDNISFSLAKGKTLGLVGESGCGKSTIGRCILRLYDVTEGKIRFNGQNVNTFNAKDRFQYCRDVQSVFQDPYGSLNPRMRIEQIIDEPMLVHNFADKAERHKRVKELAEIVGLKPDHLKRYPHEFSGGQRQRICIARALSLNPKLIVLDEPVSALDVSIRAQILNLLMDLQERFNLTYLFISHDLSVVEHISDMVAVMYLGNIVELAPCHELFKAPKHPYTKGLLSAILPPEPNSSKVLNILEGDVGEIGETETGCLFASRCPKALSDCKLNKPQLINLDKEHLIACNLYSHDYLNRQDQNVA